MKFENHHKEINSSFSGRGDLLRFLAANGEQGLLEMAGFAGYEKKETRRKEPVPEKNIEFKALKQEPTQVIHHFPEPAETLPFWYVSDRTAQAKNEEETTTPEWAVSSRDNPIFFPDSVGEDYHMDLPPHIPLVAWSRIWPLLRSSLGSEHQSRWLDTDRLINDLTRQKPIKKIPLKVRFGWDAIGCLILDFHDRLLPLWTDINRLHRGIEKLRGRSGLTVYMVENGPEGAFKKRDRRHDPVVDFVVPDPGTPMVIVSDLGYLEPTGVLKKKWLRFGRRLCRAGIVPVVLTPCPPHYWDRQLTTYFYPVWWDRGNRSFRTGFRRKGYQDILEFQEQKEELKAQRLLSLLSPAIRVEPELLRAVRTSLSCEKANAATEILAWNHPSVYPSFIAYVYDPDYTTAYRNSFRQESKAVRRTVHRLIKMYHAHLSEAILCEEEMIAGELEGKLLKSVDEFMKIFFRTLGDSRFPAQTNLEHWFKRFLKRIPKEALKKYPVLTACWVKIYKKEFKAGRVSPPEGMDVFQVPWMFSENENPETYEMRQQGSHFILSLARRVISGNPLRTGSHIVYVTSRNGCLTYKIGNDEESLKTKILKPSGSFGIPVPERGSIVFSTDMENLTLNTMRKPEWAASIGRDGEGLYVTVGKDTPLIDWPEWADLVGRDDYGVFAELKVEGITYRMRWIEPGSFLMGSPENERERSDDEKQHKVTLTRGFWLGETACTQALWEVVMRENPSDTKGKAWPVEKVSWNDCMTFIELLNKMKPGLELRLPTEAEWEYSCRAGTTTPFSFGENITTDQVNYDGRLPYGGGEKGKNRSETVYVRSLPPNSWGLYEMHGNVWEWCLDRYGEYQDGDVVDPQGPENAGYRVLRGGSFIFNGRNVRSAYRDRLGPGNRRRSIGFRLARGQKRAEPKSRHAGQTKGRVFVQVHRTTL